MSEPVNDCCCGFPSGENADNCERCGLIKQRNELVQIAELLRWELTTVLNVHAYTEEDSIRAIEVIGKYEQFLDKHSLRSLVEEID